jgi:cellulose synthase (UDP-forming)
MASIYRKLEWQPAIKRHQAKTSLIVGAALVLLASILLADLPITTQQTLSLVLFGLGLALWRYRGSDAIRLALLLLSMAASVRYICWRALHTLNLENPLDGLFSLVLFFSELYVVFILVANYFQVLSLDRNSDSVSANPDFAPSVDIFIPTYNESTDILRRTVCGALHINYQNKTVYILDDGRREEMRKLANELGCQYIVRPDNKHAKAGNINYALTQTSGDLIVVFDADHVPVENFLTKTVPYFQDPKMALVQTPHRFVNPGPAERNLYLDGTLPQEQELFYQMVQVGNNCWNSAFFCGSAAVLRRTALLEVGGIAVETVTEDCHTSMKMHALGYKSLYVSTPLSAGLSPESFAGYVVQRNRWARGMVQIMRVDNPLIKPGLSWQQRFCYFNSMMHFMFGIPRLVFYATPLMYLTLNLHPLMALPGDVVIMALPHITLATLANNYQYKNFRHSFWSEIYETTLAPYLAYVTTLALLNPKAGKFNVTPKGGLIDKPFYDFVLAWPMLVLTFLCFLGLVICPIRLFNSHDYIEQQSLIINLGWVIYNFVFASAAIWVCLERPQRRRIHRVPKFTEVLAQSPDSNNVLVGRTENLNEIGALVRFSPTLPSGSPSNSQPFHFGKTLSLTFGSDPHNLVMDADIRRISKSRSGELLIGLEFPPQPEEKYSALVKLVYCSPDTWTDFREPYDSILKSMWNIITTPIRVGRMTWDQLNT